MQAIWVGDNVVVFEPEGPADALTTVTRQDLLDQGWSEEFIRSLEMPGPALDAPMPVASPATEPPARRPTASAGTL